MELPLVVGVDGSESSLQAVDWAAQEAARRRVPLRLVHASLWERYEGGALSRSLGRSRGHGPRLGESILTCAAHRAEDTDPDVDVATELVSEDTTLALLREARNAVALVTGRRGRGAMAGLLLGSVSLAVAARAPCPVVVVRGAEAGRDGHHHRVLLAVGDPVCAADAVRFAFLEAELRRAELHAVRAWRSPARESPVRPGRAGERERTDAASAAAALDAALSEPAEAHPRVDVVPTVVEGPAHKVLVPFAADADLMVLGARHRHGRPGTPLGRVPHAMLHRAACPVAVIPHHG
ncbi:universal stress protein [Streptomyces sp. NPDC058045]|uniref:universal stress protein n=1 Tax=Streptomyces sp. NPDC058045 TaxID=3346311 RepID=UPI0036EF2F09